MDCYLTKFSLIGYRTLVFATRYLTQEEYDDIEAKYNKAMSSGDRDKNLKDLAKEIETDLTLLGATAVEDSLQVNVKDAVSRLLEADIKVWMITGDKLETAENIGLMAGIVNHEMQIFYIANVNKSKPKSLIIYSDNFMQISKDLTRAVMSYRKNHRGKKIGIVFDMRSVGKSHHVTPR